MKINSSSTDKPSVKSLKDLPPITLANRSDHKQLSFAQKRLWFMTQMGDDSNVAYNTPFGLCLHGELERATLKNALNTLIVRHEALRTTFHTQSGKPICSIKPSTSAVFQLKELDLTDNKQEKIIYQV